MWARALHSSTYQLQNYFFEGMNETLALAEDQKMQVLKTEL